MELVTQLKKMGCHPIIETIDNYFKYDGEIEAVILTKDETAVFKHYAPDWIKAGLIRMTPSFRYYRVIDDTTKIEIILATPRM